LPESQLLENDFTMSENLKSDSNLLVSSTRRNLFKGMATGLVAGSVAGPAILSGAKKPKKAGVRKGRINQSVVSWCFAKHWSVEETCKHAKNLGCKSVELIDSKYWPVLKKHGLTCAISGIPVDGPPFIKGL
jgi:hydroxypyruvate isomerase